MGELKCQKDQEHTAVKSVDQKKEREILMMKNKQYTMKCTAGEYYSDGYFQLGWEIFKHRCWHLLNHGKWMD